MEQRFLFGQEAGIDYAAIDEDAGGDLDAHWRRVEEEDAQDDYFRDAGEGSAAAHAACGVKDAMQAGHHHDLAGAATTEATPGAIPYAAMAPDEFDY
jgi:hypothetical protein